MVTTWIEVADTAVKIGLGAVAGGLLTMAVEHLRRLADKQHRDEELRRNRFVDPVVTFLDGVLAAIGEAYWAHIDRREPKATETMAFFQANQGAVEARVRALNDPELMELWAPFTRKVIEVKIRLAERQIGDPYEKMTEAFDLGGRILRRLYHLEK